MEVYYKMAKKRDEDALWQGIEESDFINEDNIDDTNIAEYSEETMAIYSANINLVRQIVRLTDSLKPVERRTLYAMYKVKAYGSDMKSAELVSAAMKFHPHGEGPLYASLINMAQYWKKNVPLVTGKSNLGSIVDPEGYAAMRYSKTKLTDYAYECFFEDFNDRAVMMDQQLTGIEEPKFMPSKFPNALINGTSGIGYGFSAIIPPFNCNDIVDLIKGLIVDPDMDDPIIYPDLPTGCDIVDDGTIEDICKTGKGTLRMRARIDIVERPETWALEIKSIPYTIPYNKIKDALIELKKTGKLEIKDIQEDSKAYKVNGKIKHQILIRVILPKALDPMRARSIIFKNTNLEKTLAIQFYVIKGDREIDIVSLKELGLAWINERRIYKRSLLNHKIANLHSTIDMLETKIKLCKEENIEKVVDIFRRNTKDDTAKALMKEYGLSSHQARICAEMSLRDFNKDALKRYQEKLKACMTEIETLNKIARSPKKIDNIILEEIEDLRKYATPRKSPIIKVTNEMTISNTDHVIVVSKNGYIKKLPYPISKVHSRAPYGTFESGDYPVTISFANNLINIMMMDDQGRYSILPVHSIPNTVHSNYGEKIFDIAKIGPNVIFALPINMDTSGKVSAAKLKREFKEKWDNISILTLSADGTLKSTKIEEYLLDVNGDLVKSIKGSKGARTRTRIVKACMWSNSIQSQFLVFTKKGNYVILDCSEIPEMGKDTMGNTMITTTDNDTCNGFGTVFMNDDTHVLVATARGCLKLVETEFMHVSKRRRDSSYIATIDPNDEIIFAEGCKLGDILVVELKSGRKEIDTREIPILARKAKPQKIIGVPPGDHIICYSLEVK